MTCILCLILEGNLPRIRASQDAFRRRKSGRLWLGLFDFVFNNALIVEQILLQSGRRLLLRVSGVSAADLGFAVDEHFL